MYKPGIAFLVYANPRYTPLDSHLEQRVSVRIGYGYINGQAISVSAQGLPCCRLFYINWMIKAAITACHWKWESASFSDVIQYFKKFFIKVVLTTMGAR